MRCGATGEYGSPVSGGEVVAVGGGSRTVLTCAASVAALIRQTGASYPTVSRAVDALQEMGIVQEITGRKRERVYAYQSYLVILSEGTEPL